MQIEFWSDINDIFCGIWYDCDQSQMGIYNVGIWGAYPYHYTYIEIEPDGKVITGRFGACMVTIVGFAVMVALWVMSCRPFKKWAIVLLSSILFLCSIFQILPLLLLASDYCVLGCTMASGSIYIIIVAMFWLVNSVIVAFMHKKRNRLPRNRKPAVETAEPVVVFVNPSTTIDGSLVSPPLVPSGNTCTLPAPVNPETALPISVLAPEIKM